MQDNPRRTSAIAKGALKIIAATSLVALFAFLFLEKINLYSADLGRHIKNGELVFSHPEILYKNFYSYVEPDHSFVNHHWLSGVLYFILEKTAGWKGLSLFNFAVGLAGLVLSFTLARKRSNFWISSIFSIPVVFLMGERNEVRPEVISGLFLMIYLWILYAFRNISGTYWQNKNALWVLFGLQVLWANTHIYSFLGILAFTFAVLAEIAERKPRSFRELMKNRLVQALGVLAIAGFATPNFIDGFLYPFEIFKSYGYEVVENKSIFFLSKLTINYNIAIFEWLMVGGIALIVMAAAIEKKLLRFDTLLFSFFLLFGAFALRNIAIAGLVALPIISRGFASILKFLLKKNPKLSHGVVCFAASAAVPLLVIVLFYWVSSGQFFSAQGKFHEFGLGLEHSSPGMGEFLATNKIEGPIFNNYDIGSYLDYYLAPEGRVFVDNRPEAYSVKFFADYRKMQEDEEFWKTKLAEYNFNAIAVTHTDGTPWADTFLGRIASDSEWRLAYLDQTGVAFLRNNEKNKSLIERYGYGKEEVGTAIESLSKDSPPHLKYDLANLARIYRQPALEQKLLRSLIASDSKNYLYKINLAVSLSNADSPEEKNSAGNLDEAQRLTEEVIGMGIGLPSIYNQLGITYMKKGEIISAREAWQNALKVDPSNEWARYYLEEFYYLPGRRYQP